VIFQEVFATFASNGESLQAIEFMKLSKVLKIYPSIITFEHLKKIILKNPEYWNLKKSH